MKNMFPGFYSPSKEDVENAWTSEDTLFVFDTSTLLNLYGYASQTRDDFFSILTELSDKIWIPYYVGLEYQRGRLRVVSNEKAIFTKTEKLLTKIDNIFTKEFSDLALNRRFPVLFKNTESLHKNIKKSISSYKKSVTYWDNKQPCVKGHDEVRDKINDAFDEKVGEIPENQKVLDKIFADGKKRYLNKMPPGYMDNNKSNNDNNRFFYSGLEFDRQYGDLLIWKQIIKKATTDDSIKSVILITDDAKEDWWYIIDSRGKKNIGPRAELREEICRDGKIDLFTMYNTADFLEEGKKLLHVDIKNESIEDAEKVFSQEAVLSGKVFQQYSDMLSESATATETLSTYFEKLQRERDPFQAAKLDSNFLHSVKTFNELNSSLFPTKSFNDFIKDTATARMSGIILPDLNSSNPDEADDE